jgi:ATP-binding cassette subfamily F protein 3
VPKAKADKADTAIKSGATRADNSTAGGTFDAKKPVNKKEEAQKRQQQSDSVKPLRKEIEKIDQRIQALTTEQTSLQAAMTTITAPAEIAQTGKRLKAIENELGTLEERWLELTEQIETAVA